MTERFRKAYDSLVRAFFEGTLAKGTCIACACGNIIFDAVGEPVKKEDLQVERSYMYSITNDCPTKRHKAMDLWGNKRKMVNGQWVSDPSFVGVVNEAGYTTEEFVKIENAFENNARISSPRYNDMPEQSILEDQYNGLCAVIDVLMKLDEDLSSPVELKQKFREHPKLVTV